MSMAKKVLFRTSDAGPDIEGLIACLRKTDPGGIAELKDRGGRLGGTAIADDTDHPDISRPVKQEKISE